jgi:uncharacterized membrane protein
VDRLGSASLRRSGRLGGEVTTRAGGEDGQACLEIEQESDTVTDIPPLEEQISSAPGPGSFSRRHGAALAIVALAFLMRLPGILRQSYWIDELITVGAVPMTWGDMVHRLIFGAETHPLLYCTLLKLWALLFGYSKLALRLFSVVSGTLFVVYCYRLAARLLSPRVAVVTALLAAASPYAIFYSQEVRSYMLFALLSTASYFYFVGYVESRAKRDYALWLLATAAAFQTHVYGAFVLVAQGIYILHLLWQRRDRALFRDQAFACVIIGLTFLPWIAVILLSKGQYLSGKTPLGYQEPLGVGHVAYVLFALFFGYSLGPSMEDLHRLHGIKAVFSTYGVVTTLAILSIVPLFGLGARKIQATPTARVLVALGAGLPLVAAFGASLVSSLAFNVRFIVPILPFFLILVAAGICSLVERGARFMGLVVPFAILVGLSLFNGYMNPRYWREDYEQTAVYLKAQPGVRVLAGAFSSALKHFLPDMDVMSLSKDELEAVKPGEKRWLVWNRTWVFDKDGRLHEQAAAEFRVLSEQRYPGFEIDLVEKK